MEKLIHKAKRLTPEDHLYLKQNLRTQEAIKKIKDEIAPRFRKLPAGFTRGENRGRVRESVAGNLDGPVCSRRSGIRFPG